MAGVVGGIVAAVAVAAAGLYLAMRRHRATAARAERLQKESELAALVGTRARGLFLQTFGHALPDHSNDPTAAMLQASVPPP